MLAAQAVQDMLTVHAHYAQRGQSLATAALAGAKKFVRWTHYPRDDVNDVAHGARFFYHAHDAQDMREAEHGHFHLFVRMPGRANTRYSHLIGVSLDSMGSPLRLFTTNQWVTGEDWTPAAQLVRQLDAFRVQTTGRLAPVARWLSGLVHFYASSIEQLLHQRDARLQAHAVRTQQPLQAAREDRALHVLSEKSLPHHWQALQQEQTS